MSYARDQVLDIADTLLERNPTSVSISTSIFNDISETIHHTPMIRLQNFSSEPYVNVYAKCEMFLPSLSTKDRIVIGIIRELERSGELKKGGTIIEASSGNTGCAVAMLAACFGYRAIISVPAKTSIEKISMMKAYGATVIISPPDASKSSPEHYVNKAKLIKDETPNSVLLNQYENPVNPNIHYQHTAAEIWGALNGNIDCVIVCSSSGGTISGIGRYLKEKKSTIEIVMPDPVGSIYHDYFNNKREDQSCYRPYKIEGIGKDYICGNIDFSVIDNVVQVTDEDAFNSAKYLAREEGILAGGSSGAALYVANVYAKKFQEKKQKANIVVVLPDSGFKYLSTFYNANE
ncbi:MAG: cysteine synthase family protein [Proteobacteria bacterium]|nr:cysteine synthase family protein [Pseudomonadota bacterium]